MARSKRSKKNPRDETPSPHLAEHMNRLGLTTIAAYREWCKEHGFPSKTDKASNILAEVSRQKVIVQGRGKRNRRPEPQELDVLRRWAEQEELGLATYL